MPAATAMKIPAARIASTAGPSAAAAQPSSGGQTYEFETTSGRRAGSGFAPAASVGARKNCRHSRYVLGRPTPSSMFRQPIQRASGATPITFSPSPPAAIPVTNVPWPLSSHGVDASNPHGLPPSPSMSPWTASCQL